MTPEQHAHAKEVFLAACEQPAEQRSAFVAQACRGDPELREHVDDLLRHHTDTDATQAAAESDTATLDASADIDREPGASTSDRGFQPGTVIADRYRIVSLLGKGGMGEVHRADDLVLEQPVALKFLPKDLKKNPTWLERLAREARIAREITHANICRVYDIEVDESAAELFISMEYVDGENLQSLLRRIGRFSQDRAIEIAREMCIGLAAAHAKGVLHRDLKPANIMIDGVGRVRITDFGLAAPREQIAADEIRSGTPGYMAPELFAGTDVSVRSDIYALGLVLYELFTGRPAFHADSITGYARLHQRSQPSPPCELVPELPPAIDRLIRQCLEKDPGDRPESALAVAAGLPGSDPLALALAAGVTPSPALVAASGAGAGMRSTAAIVRLAGFGVSLLLVVLLAGRSGLTPDLEEAKPASVLAERARQLALELGFTDVPNHEAFGFAFWPAEDFLRPDQATQDSEITLATQGSRTLKFWYRQSPTPLDPVAPLNITFGRARATLTDPPRTTPGMVTLVLDDKGQLLVFELLPRQSANGEVSRADWTPFFTAAALAATDYAAKQPMLTPRVYFDQRLAWAPRGQGESPAPARIEAAAFRGKPVFFAIVRETESSSAMSRPVDAGWRRAVANRTRVALLTIVALGALPLVRMNIRRGRGDRQGAFRISTLAFAGRLVIWALSASHTGQIEVELRLLLFAVMRAWFEASLVWVFYIALEPYVRRFWPQTLVTWSRLLASKIRDPLVGRDVLTGTLLGVCIVLLFELDRLILMWIGWEVREPLRLRYALEPLLGTRYGVAACIHSLLATVYLSLFLVTFLVIARVLLRRTWLAAIVMVVATTPMYLQGMAHPGFSWVPLVIVLACIVWAAIRYGLVVVMCAILVSHLLLDLPLSFVPGTMGSDLALFVIIILIGMAIYGFVNARRPGRPVIT